MRVMKISVNKGYYYSHDTEGHLYNFQDMVGGFIEVVRLPEFEEQGIIFLANEEGLLAMLPVNENLWPYFLVGNVVALSTEGEDFTGLSEAQEEFLKEWLANS